MKLDRTKLIDWLTDVLRQNNTTATALAKKAGIAQSTLTRFLNSPDGPMLGLQTISKVAHVTGIAPPGLVSDNDVAPRKRGGMSENEASEYVADDNDPSAVAVRAMIQHHNARSPWVLRGHALELAGYLPGDIAIVDLNEKPKRGNVVCAQLYFWNEGRADTLFRIYEPPYLIAVTNVPELQKPLLVDGDQVVIKGVVIALVRPRAA